MINLIVIAVLAGIFAINNIASPSLLWALGTGLLYFALGWQVRNVMHRPCEMPDCELRHRHKGLHVRTAKLDEFTGYLNDPRTDL